MPDQLPTRLPERPGPVALPDDSWENGSTGLHSPIRRRGPHAHQLWVVLILTATVIVTMGLPVLLGGDQRTGAEPMAESGPDRPPPPRERASEITGVAVLHTAPTAARTSSPGSAPPSPDGSSSVGASTDGAPPDGAPSPSASASPPSLPLVIEAETPAIRLRRAQVEPVAGASGESAVRFTSRSGEIRISSLAVPADGRYRITITYAPGGAWSANVRGQGGPVRVAFAAGTGCCATVTAEVSLAAGGALHIGLSGGAGSYPAVDRVIIDRV